jgi:cephalosporin-C deacetylase
MKKLLVLLPFLFPGIPAFAQPAEQMIKVIVAPDHDNWAYKTGENIRFSVTVLQYGNPLKNVKIVYQIGPEKFETKKDSAVLGNGTTNLEGGSMAVPGFLRCIVTAKVGNVEYRNLATAAVEPEKIAPVVKMPDDFVAFWENAKADLAKTPLDAKMTLLPERCTETVNVYHLNLQNSWGKGTARVYGILCVPKKEGKYPALLYVPGAGIRPYGGQIKMAEKGIITLEIGIHGVPVNLEASVYTDMGASLANQYFTYNLDNRDLYYYKRVYLGCVRANDFLVQMPQFDGSNLAVTGGSQGGALSIVTAALDPRVKWTAPVYPALSDMAGYLEGRAGGWPHIFDTRRADHASEAKVKTAAYYDVVNFAKQLKIPCLYSMGFNDEVCPPTSMYAAYNSIPGQKALKLFLDTGHWTYQEERNAVQEWLLEKLGKR